MKNWKWTIGSAPAAIAPGGVVVLENGYEQLAHRLWEMLNADAGLGRILQEITAASNADLESLPSFVVMIHNGDSEHIAVRGSFDIDLHMGGHSQTISGASLITWSEQRDIRAEGWRIRSTLAAIDPVATEWTASSGVLPIHTLSSGSEGSGSSDKEGDTAELSADILSDIVDDNSSASRALVDDHEESAEDLLGDTDPITPVDGMPAAELQEAALVEEPQNAASPAESEEPVETELPSAPEDNAQGAPEREDIPEAELDVTEADPAHEGAALPEAEETEAEEIHEPEPVAEVIDHVAIFDEEAPMVEPQPVDEPVEAAQDAALSEEPIVVAEPVEDHVDAAHSVDDEEPAFSATPTNVSEEYPAEFTSGKFFIDSVPQEFIPSDTQSTPEEESDFGDHAGDTVMVSGATVSDPHGADEVPQILAILCEDGHPNPTHVKQCRVCEKPMSRNLVRVPRPPLGSLIFSTGEVVSLDRDVVVGRRPSAKQQEGRPEPRLVSLPSPNREISRNHCEIRVDGWDIRIRDLGSNNGTFLTREGQEPLRVGEAFPVILRNGDTIDLGESITIRLEY
ncbi:FHA domain-containing protein [Schaalia sp. Marseille-Q2122]|uniref:FHA domain-containing protein n=1 Tax=Schaalia sp. Marseille-Q2122 TaxID=2736604 RepID=UPI00158DCF96|nr:FHA domain-containing protein [Schaalia sp. Marseille-Q2122]